MSGFQFVPSTSVPEWMTEKVARHAHRRGCGAFDGGQGHAVPAPKFEGAHRDQDLVWASIHIADLCNALKVTPQQIADAAVGASGDVVGDVRSACLGIPEMLRTLADERRPGPVADMVRKRADRMEVLLERLEGK